MERLRLGLRLVKASLLLPAILLFFCRGLGTAITVHMEAAAVLAAVSMMLIGTIFCLSAPTGRATLLLCLAMDVAVVLLMFHNPRQASLVLMALPAVFVVFLHQLACRLDHLELRNCVRKTVTSYLWSVVAVTVGMVLGMVISFIPVLGLFISGVNLVELGVAVLFLGLGLGLVAFFYGLCHHYKALNLAIQACTEELAGRREQADIPLAPA